MTALLRSSRFRVRRLPIAFFVSVLSSLRTPRFAHEPDGKGTGATKYPDPCIVLRMSSFASLQQAIGESKSMH